MTYVLRPAPVSRIRLPMGFASFNNIPISARYGYDLLYPVSGVPSHVLVSPCYILIRKVPYSPPPFSSATRFTMMHRHFWKTVPGPRLLRLITVVSAVAISYEGMSQGVMGAVNVAPEYGV